MNSRDIEAKIEKLRKEESAIWANIPVDQVTGQILGRAMDEATYQKVAEARIIRDRITSLEVALYVAQQSEARKRDEAQPKQEMPLH